MYFLGTVGAVLRKLAPDKVAMTEEEILKLLEADILSKVHDQLNEDQEDTASENKENKTSNLGDTDNRDKWS